VEPLEMIFVGATVLIEASVIVGATVLKKMCIGDTVLKKMYIGATVLKATVLEGATVLGGRPRKCGYHGLTQ
jgi:hypothetical protein